MRQLAVVFLVLLLVINTNWTQAQTSKVLYLTFDDGPTTGYERADFGPTLELLDILDNYNVKATFFLPGESINSWEAPVLARMLISGHAVGIHSYHHGASFVDAGMTDQELAGEYFAARGRVFEILADYPVALEIFRNQPPLYRRPGGFPRLNNFINPTRNQFLSSARRSTANSTYDYSGWNLQYGDATPMVLRYVNLGVPLEPVSEPEQILINEAFWSFLFVGRLSTGTQSNHPGLSGFRDSIDEAEGLVILAHDTFTAVVRSWDVTLPRLMQEGYIFDILPRPGDAPASYIMGLDDHPRFP